MPFKQQLIEMVSFNIHTVIFSTNKYSVIKHLTVFNILAETLMDQANLQFKLALSNRVLTRLKRICLVLCMYSVWQSNKGAYVPETLKDSAI